MSASDPEVVVDNVCDLSSAKESILFFSCLFSQTDLILEVGIQSSHLASQNSGIECHQELSAMFLKSSTESTISTSLTHDICLRGRTGTSTHLGFESSLPTWKCWKCGKVVKMNLRDLKFLLISLVILRIWSFCWQEIMVDGFLANLGVGIAFRFCFHF